MNGLVRRLHVLHVGRAIGGFVVHAQAIDNVDKGVVGGLRTRDDVVVEYCIVELVCWHGTGSERSGVQSKTSVSLYND